MIGPLPEFQQKLLTWYARARRDLPWRVSPAAAPDALPDPYHVLLSETMLQQTQVATVIPYFHRFLTRFPRIQDLAGADLQDVLRLWQGLGYYSRARNLHRCAQSVVADHAGAVPREAAALLGLPGVGRYTAGAIASLAFGRRAPILDGNVTRVLCRIDKVEADPRQKDAQVSLWRRAEEVLPDRRVGDFNSALMELGATVCTPRNPQCLICPVRDHCEAQAAGLQERIPVPKKAKPTPLFARVVLCVRRGDQYLIEQRPARGRWAGLWQFKTLDLDGAKPTPARLGELLKFTVRGLRRLGVVTHALTHRRYTFDVYACAWADGDPAAHSWSTLAELDRYPLPKPHVEVAKMLAADPGDA